MPNLRTILLGALALVVSSCAEETTAPSQNKEIQEIDSELNTLNTELKELRREAFNDEMKAQPNMFDHWHEYTDDINSNETDEKKIQKVKSKINDLMKRKQELLNEPK